MLRNMKFVDRNGHVAQRPSHVFFGTVFFLMSLVVNKRLVAVGELERNAPDRHFRHPKD